MWVPIYGASSEKVKSKRFNPWSILIFFNRFLIFLGLLGALISLSIAPKDNYANEVEGRFQRIRAAGIAIFSIAIAFFLVQIALECLTCLKHSIVFSVIANVIDVLMILGVLGISIAIVATELLMPPAQFTNAVKPDAHLASGLLGAISAALYIASLFLSRFFQSFAENDQNV